MGTQIPIAEAARRLSISKSLFWRLVREGHFAANRGSGRGRRTTVDEAKVYEYARALEATALLNKPDTPIYAHDEAQPEPDGRVLIRAVEAAKIIGITRRRMAQLIANRRIVFFRIGRCVLLRPCDVRGYKAYMSGEKIPTNAQPNVQRQGLVSRGGCEDHCQARVESPTEGTR